MDGIYFLRLILMRLLFFCEIFPIHDGLINNDNVQSWIRCRNVNIEFIM